MRARACGQVLMSAREQPQGLFIGVPFLLQNLRNLVSLLRRPTAGECQSLKLTESYITGQILQSLTHHVVSQECFPKTENPLAKNPIEIRVPRPDVPFPQLPEGKYRRQVLSARPTEEPHEPLGIRCRPQQRVRRRRTADQRCLDLKTERQDRSDRP